MNTGDCVISCACTSPATAVAGHTVRCTIADNEIGFSPSERVQHERDRRRKCDVGLENGDVR